MGKYTLNLAPIAQKDLQIHYNSGNKVTINKINKILEELIENPFVGEGKPEELKHEFKGYWSRRINKRDRLIYRVDEQIGTVFIVSAMGHFSDK